jgi:hypothetical protein
MSSSRAPRVVLIAALVSLALLLAGCGSSSDPSSWEEAEDQVEGDEDFPVKSNFLEACNEANAGEGGFDDSAARAYCRCAFQELRESLEFVEFDALDDGLRKNPDPDALEGTAAAAWQVAEPLLEACAADATA